MPVKHFVDDWAPIGMAVLTKMEISGLIVMTSGKLAIVPEGEKPWDVYDKIKTPLDELFTEDSK